MVVSTLDNIPDVIFDILGDLGMRADLKGYKYIAKAIHLGVENEKVVEQITNIVYPSIAKEFDTEPARVERDMRHAIESTFRNISDEIVYKYFKNSISKEKPTNSHFIATIVRHVRRKLINM